MPKKLPKADADQTKVQADKDRLYKLCRKFVEKQDISCPETIY